MFDKLQAIEERYDKLMALIADPAVQADQQEYRRHTGRSPRYSRRRAVPRVQAVVEELAETRELAAGEDDDLRELAEQELIVLEERRDTLLGAIKVLLLPKDPNDEKNVVLEIRAAPAATRRACSPRTSSACTSASPREQGWRVEVLSSTRPASARSRRWWP